MRRSQSRSSASLVVFASESMGVECRTLANWPLDLAADPLRGRVGRNQLGMLRLQLDQLVHQPIEFGIADLGIVEDVVAVLVIADLVAQGLRSSAEDPCWR